MATEWKTIPNFDDYKISNNGEVISIVRYVYSKKEKTVVPFYREKVLKQFKNRGGYMCVGIGSKGNRKTMKIHRLVATAFIPNPQNLPEVNHKDGDKTNNCVNNLEWCTASENVRHAYRTGIQPRSPKRINLFMKNRKENSVAVCLASPDGLTEKFSSIQKCAEALGIDRSTVSKAISKNKKIKGYKIYLNEVNENEN